MPPPPIIEQQTTNKTDDLSSERGVNYTKLRDLLAGGEWKKADEETLAVMLQATSRETEGYLDIESIENFPCTDLRTIDQLWVEYSDGRFGFSVQKRIVQSVGGEPGKYDREIYLKFAERVGWLVYEKKWLVLREENWTDYPDLTFNPKAPEGHLPYLYPKMGLRVIEGYRTLLIDDSRQYLSLNTLLSRRDL
ncbi:MAG: GUN4 domain-containing protein [Symploca sp. SIO2E9]|nr:GUN4 domain-containing protein [Symploca sp. SIO2E9]